VGHISKFLLDLSYRVIYLCRQIEADLTVEELAAMSNRRFSLRECDKTDSRSSFALMRIGGGDNIYRSVVPADPGRSFDLPQDDSYFSELAR
jgi:GDP-D-mannose dehydratase